MATTLYIEFLNGSTGNKTRFSIPDPVDDIASRGDDISDFAQLLSVDNPNLGAPVQAYLREVDETEVDV